MRKKKQKPLTDGLSLLPFIEEFHSKEPRPDFQAMLDDAVYQLELNGYIKHPIKSISYGRFIIKEITPTGKPVPQKERDYEDLARKMIDLFPKGTQPNTGYPWRCSVAKCIQRLKMLNNNKELGPISCTDEEILRATRAYAAGIANPNNRRRILHYFIIKQVQEGDRLVSTSELLDWVEMTAGMSEDEMQQAAPKPLEEAELL